MQASALGPEHGTPPSPLPGGDAQERRSHPALGMCGHPAICLTQSCGVPHLFDPIVRGSAFV
eukprot:363549-Chlamydomonas_euryale.AAC.8